MMEDLLRVVFLLCALAAPGHSLSCLNCVAKDSTCKGVSEGCYHSCGLVFQETTEDGKTSRDYIKTCINTELCNKVSSISHISGIKKFGISCCYTDNCTPSLPKLPTNSPQANGITCPTCRDTKKNNCSPKTNIKCSGNEQMCIRYDVSSPDAGESLVGCATQSICSLGFNHRLENGYLYFSFSCKPGTSTTSERSRGCSRYEVKCRLPKATANSHTILTTNIPSLFKSVEALNLSKAILFYKKGKR
ncbi:phospholipase A2 inhibitor and Ly6/PLAUR domain-containing protein-like [Lithobates pipiens]